MTAYAENGTIQAFDVPETCFGYSAFSLMIPPFPVMSALFLGWGEGNVAALMDKIWPVGTDTVGVDLREPIYGRMPNAFIQGDADEFVKNSERVYDFVCIDLYQGRAIPSFVFTESFVDNVGRITGKLLAINLTFYSIKDLDVYGRHFLPDAYKKVNSDHVMMMIPRVLVAKMKELKN